MFLGSIAAEGEAMKDIGLELQQIANGCDNVRRDALRGDTGEAVRQLSVTVEDLADLVERIHRSLNNKR